MSGVVMHATEFEAARRNSIVAALIPILAVLAVQFVIAALIHGSQSIVALGLWLTGVCMCGPGAPIVSSQGPNWGAAMGWILVIGWLLIVRNTSLGRLHWSLHLLAMSAWLASGLVLMLNSATPRMT